MWDFFSFYKPHSFWFDWFFFCFFDCLFVWTVQGILIWGNCWRAKFKCPSVSSQTMGFSWWQATRKKNRLQISFCEKATKISKHSSRFLWSYSVFIILYPPDFSVNQGNHILNWDQSEINWVAWMGLNFYDYLDFQKKSEGGI